MRPRKKDRKKYFNGKLEGRTITPARLDRMEKVLDMWLRGATITDTAEACGVSKATIQKDREIIEANWKIERPEFIDRYKGLLHSQYERLMFKWFNRAMGSDADAKAVMAWTKLAEGYQKLHGINGPKSAASKDNPTLNIFFGGKPDEPKVVGPDKQLSIDADFKIIEKSDEE